jgi:VanZ family protein
MNIITRHWKSIAWALLIFVFCAIPVSSVPHYKLFLFPHFDKLVHLFFYWVLGSILFYEMNAISGYNSIGFKSIVIVGTITIGYGFFIELIQFILLPGRTGDLWDVFANTTGFFLSAILYKLHLAFNKKRI